MFKAGDLVRCKSGENYYHLKIGKVYEVKGTVTGGDVIRIVNDVGTDYYYESNLFELVTEKENTLETTAKKPHQHRDLIIAWANGEKVQVKVYDIDQHVENWQDEPFPEWYSEFEYRIKPEPKPDQTRTMFVELHPKLDNAFNKPNIKLTFDGETENLKAVEIIRYD